MSTNNGSQPTGNTMVGILLLISWIVTIGGVGGAIGALIQSDFMGVGACLTASALSCGLTLNAFLRT